MQRRPAPRKPRVVAVLGAAAILASACGGSSSESSRAPTSSPVSGAETATAAEPEATAEDVLDAYIAAWVSSDWDAMAGLVADPALGAGAVHRSTWEDLGLRSTSIEVLDDLDAVTGDELTVRIEVTVEIDQIGSWTYPNDVALTRRGSSWSIAWSPTTVHPALIDGRRLAAVRQWPARGAILAVDGTPLLVPRPLTTVGVEPQRIEDREQLLADLETLLDVEADEVATSLDAPGVQPDWFVPVTVLEDDVGSLTLAALEGLPGVILRESEQRRAPTPTFAAQALGVTGPITAEQLAEWGPPYGEGDVVGSAGLELRHERELAGSPGGDVRVVDAAGELVAVLHRRPGTEPVDVLTTLDADVQAAAEEALDDVQQPAALVAIDAKSGGVRAVVSRPAEQFGRAFGGAYPAGSTFKVVTAAAALSAGLQPASPAPCPAETFFGGLRFTNAGGSALGAVDMATSFAASCNTAFVDLVADVGAAGLDEAATWFGIGAPLDTGLGAFGGSLPEPVDDAELGAHAIGQGRVTVSPLAMAAVAAAVADGTWREPVLVTVPGGPAPETRAIPDEVVTGLRAMMRSVVTSGTATALSSVPGEVIAKTGSAEFGAEDPPETHAWVIGARGDLAFAVIIEGGGGGGAVAAPVAAAFLTALAD